ncbi:uncharacterized protein YjiS (DUF1127 family) [Bradyrhizobium huanghuaihaiense]|uniref:Uncharacterized protein DUF1127 n=1 Tax=Bradyrhizobium huanghuaihaiense TaxID=990078 RepID=A0A562RSX5_9BRAD|nr:MULTISPECIES: DUF1127 domain-containing protein [Bradyrhizobium]TWI72175.1 uncharacterized protein DUF1127 [Bradyrhizobium huanghuaihaiense]UWU73844.1 DUF1127 domain-containing protein [Bradyrhizobium sp. CB3035]
MLKQYLSSNVNRMVRPSRMRIGQIARGLGGKLVRAVYPDMPGYTRRPPLAPAVDADSPTSRWWRTGLAFSIGGLALYGEWLHPSTTFIAEAALVTAHAALVTGRARQARRAGGCPPSMAHGHGSLQPPRVAPELAARVELRLRRRGNWMSELREKFVALWAHWRREREIKSAIAALSKYDERTLRDLGIHGRADIERMVRYCRDC